MAEWSRAQRISNHFVRAILLAIISVLTGMPLGVELSRARKLESDSVAVLREGKLVSMLGSF